MPLRSYEGEIEVVSTGEDARRAVADLEGKNLLGFDTETRPAFRKGQHYLPALLQLASRDRVFLFQLNRIADDAIVHPLLARESLCKTGVSVHDDVAGLQERCNFRPAGFLDLGDVARSSGMKTHGLRNLAANLLGFRISKSAQVSNWAAEELSRKQIRYAATDAWVGLLLHDAMRELGLLG